jgi:hypothetical protein
MHRSHSCHRITITVSALTMNLLGILTGCDSSRAPYGPDVSASVEPLWADPTVFWSQGKVAVCWDNPGAATPTQQGWVRQAIARTWSFAGNLEFTGWDTCAPTSSGLRIHWQDDALGPRVNNAFGANLNGLAPGLILDNTFSAFSVSPSTPKYSFVITCTTSSTPAQLQACIENIAIHEFGHVLGFHHEQNAPGASSQSDFPTSCSQLVSPDAVPGGGVLYQNHWDLNSVMNYCSPAYGGSHLSSLDFAGMISFYGVSPRFVAALVGGDMI